MKIIKYRINAGGYTERIVTDIPDKRYKSGFKEDLINKVSYSLEITAEYEEKYKVGDVVETPYGIFRITRINKMFGGEITLQQIVYSTNVDHLSLDLKTEF